MSILEGIVNQIGALNPDEAKWAESKKIGSIFKKMATAGAKVAASTIGVEGDVIDDLFESDDKPSSDIVRLKEEIAALIDQALQKNPDKQWFTFILMI